MSIIIQSKGDVTKSATNNSVSKFMYSFSKAPRFPSFKISGHTDAYYDIPVTRSTRATNFGFGNRSDFTMGKSKKKNDKDDKEKTVIPTNEEEKVKYHGPVYSFPKYDPTKKHKVTRKDVNGNELPEFKDPTGPGYYNILRPFGSDALKFTMKGRIDGKKDDKKKKDENENKDSKQQEEESYSLKNKAGKYVLSNMINMPTFNFGDKNQARFKYKYSDTPGPAPKLKEGEEEKPFFGRPHFNSKYRSNNGITISGRTKQIDSRSNYPGPGSYRLPSEWGQYQSKDADKYPTENVYPVKKIPFEEKAWRHNMKVVKEKSDEEYMEKEEVDKKSDQPKLGGDEDEKKDEGEEQVEGYVDKEEEDKKVEEEPKTNEQGEEVKKEGDQPQTETQKEDEKKDEEKKEDEKKDEEKKDEPKKEGEEQAEGFVDNEEKDKKVEGDEANPSAQKEEEKKEEPKKDEEKKDEPKKEEEEKKEQGEMFIDNEEDDKKVEGEEANPSAQKATTNEQPSNANAEEKKEENAKAEEEKKDENAKAEEKKDENANEEEKKEEFFLEQEEKEENINNLNQ